MGYPETQGLIDYFTRIDEILVANITLQREIRDALLQLTTAIQALQLKPTIIPRHENNMVGTSPQDTINGELYAFSIHNTHAANILYISFDGGTTYKQIASEAVYSLSGPNNIPITYIDKIKLKASAANTTYEIVYLVKMP